MVYNLKPIIVVSKCLGFDHCRYNGGIENNTFIEKLGEYVQFITVCPESDSGMPTPRETIRIIQNNDDIDLIQSSTGKICTTQINEFLKQFLDNLKEVDGFILKNKSPSCGVKDARIYSSASKGADSKKGQGLFTKHINDRFNTTIVEDEGRLTNFKIREHFLTRIYVIAGFRQVKNSKSLDGLRSFHLRNVLLFIAYSQKYSKLLDVLIYNDEKTDIPELFRTYEDYLLKLLDRAPRYTSNINVLVKSVDGFKDKISADEMQFIWNIIDKYKKGYVPFSVPLYVVKGYIIRFDLQNLINQSFFMPYPEELIQVNDSGKLIH